MSAMTINTISDQSTGVEFTVSGTYQVPNFNLSYVDGAGTLQYADDVAITSTVATWSFVHPGIAASGSQTVIVVDENYGELAMSNSFNVAQSISGVVFWNAADKAADVKLSNNFATATASGGAAQAVRSNLTIPQNISGTITVFEVILPVTGSAGSIALVASDFALDSSNVPGTMAGSFGVNNSGGSFTVHIVGNLDGGAGHLGDTLSVAIFDNKIWVSTDSFRAASGHDWLGGSGDPSANPGTSEGGYVLTDLHESDLYLMFYSHSDPIGFAATINDGAKPFSVFLQNFMASYPSAASLASVVS